VTGKNIQELGQLVQIGMTKKAAHPGDAGISFGGLSGIGFRIDLHRTELDTGKGAAKETNPFLHEEDRSFRIQFDQKKEDGEKPAENENQHQNRNGDVKYSFAQEIRLPLTDIRSEIYRTFFFCIHFLKTGFSDTCGSYHMNKGLAKKYPSQSKTLSTN
jgi:hypothetical protein